MFHIRDGNLYVSWIIGQQRANYGMQMGVFVQASENTLMTATMRLSNYSPGFLYAKEDVSHQVKTIFYSRHCMILTDPTLPCPRTVLQRGIYDHSSFDNEDLHLGAYRVRSQS